jgi:hypothetical protein
MKNCDYILVKIIGMSCTFKPMYKEDLEKWFIEAEVKKEECIFLEDFEELDSCTTRKGKYIIIKGEIVLPKEEKTIIKLTL